jgi:hypothetical protein
MTRPQIPHAYPICPTCESDVSDKKEFRYFASSSTDMVNNDDASNLREEASRLVYFLGALAQAAPLAVAQAHERFKIVPVWVDDLRALAEELTEETARRLELVYRAGSIWKERAEDNSARKEG